jgi:hypothetical protein
MNKILLVICAVFGLAMSLAALPEGAVAVLLVLVVSFPVLYIIRNYSEEKEFLTNLFLMALLVRLAFGFAIQILEIKMLLAEDSMMYDAVGGRLVEIWQGLTVPNDDISYRANDSHSPGWGMYYLTAAIYYICGRSLLVAQSFCAVIGAATAAMVYFCAEKIYNNRRVAKISAIFIAFFPSFIIWSSQLLKDGLIIFLLVVAMTMVIQLQKKFNYSEIIILLLSLFGILSLRFYIFYMVAFAVAGSFIIGLNPSVKSVVRNTLVIVFLGVGLTYLGVIRTAETDFSKYASLERIQLSRSDLAEAAKSGFAEDVDVSTTEGAISAIPIGFAYLMFAPFPWEVDNFRQAATLPEVFLWWAMIPLLISGLWYTIKNRFRNATSILIFSLMLTLAYSIFQGNVGTAYRQRTQIQVFLFIFIAVGWTILKEKSENRKAIKKLNRQRVEKRLRDLRQPG